MFRMGTFYFWLRSSITCLVPKLVHLRRVYHSFFRDRFLTAVQSMNEEHSDTHAKCEMSPSSESCTSSDFGARTTIPMQKILETAPCTHIKMTPLKLGNVHVTAKAKALQKLVNHENEDGKTGERTSTELVQKCAQKKIIIANKSNSTNIRVGETKLDAKKRPPANRMKFASKNALRVANVADKKSKHNTVDSGQQEKEKTLDIDTFPRVFSTSDLMDKINSTSHWRETQYVNMINSIRCIGEKYILRFFPSKEWENNLPYFWPESNAVDDDLVIRPSLFLVLQEILRLIAKHIRTFPTAKIISLFRFVYDVEVMVSFTYFIHQRV